MDRRAARDAQAEREAAKAAELHRQQEERAARRIRRRAGEPYQSVAQLERVDRLDAPGGAPDPADVEWLVRTASLGPEVISEAAAAELIELAQDRQVPWATREAAQALALRDQARFHPERLAGHADGLVGVLITEITTPAGSTTGLIVPSDPLSGIEALGRRQRREMRISCLESAVGHLVEAGADDAISVRAAATRLLGMAGSRPVHLPAVMPRLYTGLLHAEDQVRRAAVHSCELPRVFRTGELRLIHAASCPFRYSSRTSCGVL